LERLAHCCAGDRELATDVGLAGVALSHQKEDVEPRLREAFSVRGACGGGRWWRRGMRA
jgi:hypothetical protein